MRFEAEGGPDGRLAATYEWIRRIFHRTDLFTGFQILESGEVLGTDQFHIHGASGVGAVSATTAYGTTRADWSYVPGGVISGTAIIRPDLPELLKFPYLWQQTEYVLGGGSSHYMFLVLAAQSLLK